MEGESFLVWEDGREEKNSGSELYILIRLRPTSVRVLPFPLAPAAITMYSNIFCHCSLPAVYICLCAERCQYFCATHYADHAQKPAANPHSQFPAEADECIQKLGLKGYMQRKARVEDTAELLSAKIAQAQRDRETIEKQFADFARALESHKRVVLEELDAFLREVGQYQQIFIANRDQLLYSITREPRTQLEEIALGRRPLESLKLLSDKDFRTDATVPGQLTFTSKVKYNHGLFAISQSMPNLPVLLNNSVYRLGLEAGSRPQRVRLSSSIGWDSSYCLLDDNRALVCGGDEDPQRTLEVNLQTGETKNLGKMVSRREKEAGVIYFSPAVYIFGGMYRSSILRSCEKFDPKRNKWTDLPSMNSGRKCFSPCALGRSIYLVWGYTRSVERFDLDSGQFQGLESSAIAPEPAFSIVLGEKIVAFCGGKMYQTRVDNFHLVEYSEFLQFPRSPCTYSKRIGDCYLFVFLDSSQETAGIWQYDCTSSSFSEYMAEIHLR